MTEYEYAIGYYIELKDGSTVIRPRYSEPSREAALRQASALAGDGYVALRRRITEWEEL